uniref:Uncharacterized protein LOC111125579 isoform X1 n=1 Tax=Crassostrea virginica TaxID=6565 RepID=A0A8B8DE90_CRAVI|nr:uncharacterized protein LOC111125579 isoform X1 [Crassostrea virginica]
MFGNEEFAALGPITWALMGVVILMIVLNYNISNIKPCDLKTALDSIHLEFTPHPCKYNAIKEMTPRIRWLAGFQLFWMFLNLFYVPYLFSLTEGRRTLWICVAVYYIFSGIFCYFFLDITGEIPTAKEAQTNVNYAKLQSAMVSELEKRYSSDNISSGDKYSQAWNNFFIQYDCCAVREVQGTTNDFDNTPWCTTNGSCHANTSHIPMTCCKDVTQDDYQNAPATCHASVNPGTYRQSCMSRMRELSVVNVRESDVNSLFQYGYTIAIYQIIELFWTMCLAVKLYRKFKKENEKEDKKKMKLLFN